MGLIHVKKWIPRAAVLLAAAIVSINSIVLVEAAPQDSRVVRIPYGYNDFLGVDRDGNVFGYYAEYLEKLAEVNNWEYEYVEATWTDAIEMLEQGDIDLLYPTNYSEERDAFMDFSDIPTGYIASGIFALEDSGYQYEDYSSFEGARIAYVKDSSNALQLEELAQERGFSFTSVYRNTNYEIIEALNNGEADLVVFNSAASFPDGVLVSVLEAEPVYLAVQEGDAELLAEVNSGMQKLLKTDSALVAETIQKTLSGDGSSIVAFTNEEKAFIESGGEVTVGLYTESEPLFYIKEDGTNGGVYIEILEYLHEKTGLNITPCPVSRDQDWKELLETGEIDFFMGVSDVTASGESGICTTDAFMEYANILVIRNDCKFSQLENPVIALTYDRADWGDYLEKELDRGITIQYYPTTKDCLLAVSQGKADASLLNNMEFNYQSKNNRFSGLTQWTMYRFPTSIRVAASARVDDVTFSTVNKMMKLVTFEYVNNVVDECLNMPYNSYSAGDILYNARVPLMFVGFVVLTIGVIVAAVWIFRRKQQKLLQEALDNADRANAAKTDFLSCMSHDIRTPLNAIMGMTAIAEVHAEEPQRVRESLEKISDASHYLLSLINDVLDMSKIESGKLKIEEANINLSELINSFLTIIQPRINEHRHELKVCVQDVRHENVIGDRLRLEQILMNLMDNAIKYTPNGGQISLNIREMPTDTPSMGCYEFIVADNGIGMSKEFQEHIFEPFRREEDLRISKIQGTGLGMSITHNIVRMMNGSITVESESGKGSTFTVQIYLKFQEKEDTDTSEPGKLSVPAADGDSGENRPRKAQYTGRRVLLVEDVCLNREVAKEFLGMVDLTVEEAEDGRAALDMFSASAEGYYDMIFMDIRMPVMNGYDATRAIRALDRRDAQNVPIIAMTADAFLEDIQKAKSAGMNEHMAKPIDLEKLNEILKKYLG